MSSGWPAWHEFDLLDQTLAIGDARLKVVKRITRCAAVNVDPDTAARDLGIPQALTQPARPQRVRHLCRGDRRRHHCRRRRDHGGGAAAVSSLAATERRLITGSSCGLRVEPGGRAFRPQPLIPDGLITRTKLASCMRLLRLISQGIARIFG